METWIIRPATTKMLAGLYGVSRTIITRHIGQLGDKVGNKAGNFWTVKQVIAILDNLGPPPGYDVIYPNASKR